MPFFGIESSHIPCSVYIQGYLEKKGKRERAIAFDYLNISERERPHWAAVMDATREAFNNHTPWNGKLAVMYQHIVISPDPRDKISTEDLRKLTMDFVHKFFGKDGYPDGSEPCQPGELGAFETAVVYHEDNTNHIKHAHIIVNNTDLISGYRLHLDDYMNEIVLPNYAQELGKEYGLTYFDNPVTLKEKREWQREAKKQAKQRAKLMRAETEVMLSEGGGRYTTKTEKRIIREGKFSWKQDLCNMIQIARRTSKDEEQFLAELNELHVGVREKGDDWVFSHPSNPQYWECTGYRLGKNYTRQGINNAILTDQEKHCPRIPEVRNNVNCKLLETYGINMTLVAIADRSTDIHDVAKTLRTNDRYGIRCQQDYKRIANILELQIAEAPNEESAATLKKNLKDLKEAEAISEKGDFFLGVDDTHQVPETPGKRKPASGSGKKSGKASSKSQKKGSQSKRKQERSQSAQRANTRSNRSGNNRPKGGGRR